MTNIVHELYIILQYTVHMTCGKKKKCIQLSNSIEV